MLATRRALSNPPYTLVLVLAGAALLACAASPTARDDAQRAVEANVLAVTEKPVETDEAGALQVAEPVARSDGKVLGSISPREGLAYDCSGLGTSPAGVARFHPVVAELVDAAHPEDPDLARVTPELTAALDRARALHPDDLTMFERVVLQNTALSVGLRLKKQLWEKLLARDVAATRASALELVAALALPAEALAGLGDQPSRAAEAWVGAEEEWVERRGPACGPLARHDAEFDGARAFRPVRSGERRALVSQLVAIDTEGTPRVTPYVGQIEMRRGMEAQSAVCVVEMDGAALRAGAAEGLRAVPIAELHPTRFVRPVSGGQIGCANCHTGEGPFDLLDLSSAEGAAFAAERRQSLLSFAEQSFLRARGEIEVARKRR